MKRNPAIIKEAINKMERRLAVYELGNMVLKGFVEYMEGTDILNFNTFDRERKAKMMLPVSRSELIISNLRVIK